MTASYNILAYHKDDFLTIVSNIVRTEKYPFKTKKDMLLLKLTLINMLLTIFAVVLFHTLVGPWFNHTTEIYYFQRWTKNYKLLTSIVYLFFFSFLVGSIVLPIQWFFLYLVYFIIQLEKVKDAFDELSIVTEDGGFDAQINNCLKQYFKHFIWIKK